MVVLVRQFKKGQRRMELVDIGQEWKDREGELDSEKLIRERLPLFKRTLAGLKIKSILELGCSNGFNLTAISKVDNYQLTGLDISDKAIKRANNAMAEYIVGNAFNTGFKDKDYDLILCCGLFCCFWNPFMPALYYEVERLSRKYILVIDYYGNDKHSGLELKSGTVDWHKRDYSEIFPKFRLIKFEKYLPEIDGFSLWLFERKV